jgi:predicted transcriptional regulator
MKTFPVRLDEELHRRLRHAAIDEGVSLQEWIAAAIAERLQRTERENESEAVPHNERTKREGR